ncbi:hypothetical protein [Pedobacter sp.]
MKIELKNIKHSPSLSEETEAFTANIYIDDVLAGYASNRGHGGPTDYGHANEKGRELIKKAEEYCNGLPPTQYPATENMEAFSVDMNLENYIDELLGKHLDQKILQQFRNQIKRAMEKSIVVGVPDQSFRQFSFKTPIAQILNHPRGHEVLASNIREGVIPKMKEGEMILNTNIPISVYAEAKIPENRYVEREQQEKQASRETKQKKTGKKL